MQTIKGDLK